MLVFPPAILRQCLFAGLQLWFLGDQAAGQEWKLSSPDGSQQISLLLSKTGSLSYQAYHEGDVVLGASPLGITLEGQDFHQNLRFHRAGKQITRLEHYSLYSGIKPQVEQTLHERTIEFHNDQHELLLIDLAASDEGVAFRYRFPANHTGTVAVKAEATGFQIPSGAQGWLQPYHSAGKYTPSYEDFYFRVAPGELPPYSREKPRGWCFPLLFEIPSSKHWVLITEVSSLQPYPGCHIAPDSSDGIYRIAFPWEDELGDQQDFEKLGTSKAAPPRYQLPWTMPWRAIIMAKNAAEIATSTLVTDLAPPSQIDDTSWIKPGRASWGWWTFPDGPFTAAVFDEFTDLAASMNWEYTLFDANWWQPGIESLVSYANYRKVAPMLWTHARDFYDEEKRRTKLDELARYGAVGLKADFWCSDRQETLSAMMELFREAANRRLLVNLHGCTLPRGWHRTWPNFMTAEAVLGAESYIYESEFSERAAELHTLLPFIRNVVGPMDYTPVAISNKRYRRTTTAAHELATAIIFTSGIIHYADRPGLFGSFPLEAVKVLKDAPARWDETRCLIGQPGRLVVFARRTGASWFLAGINGTPEHQSFLLDMAPFDGYSKWTLICEGDHYDKTVIVEFPSATRSWRHSIPARGGFILRLDR